MSTEITQTVDNELYINNKYCYKDTNGNWVCTQELTTAETEALSKHIASQ